MNRNEVFYKINILLKEIKEFEEIHIEFKEISIINRVIKNNSKKMISLRKRISDSMQIIETFHLDFLQIDLPQKLSINDIELIKSVKIYFNSVIKFIRIRKEINAYSNKNTFVLFKEIKTLLNLEKKLQEAYEECKLNANQFNLLKKEIK